MNAPRRLLTPLAAAAALALIAAGCGGDDPEELSKEDFTAQADAVCAAADAQLTATADQMFGDAEEALSPKEQEAFVTDVVAPSLEQQLDGIRALTPPAEDAEQVDEVLDALSDLVEQAETEPAALLSGEGGVGEKASRLADEYGLAVCGG